MEKQYSITSSLISVFSHPFLMPSYSILLLFVYTNFHYLYANQIWALLLPIMMFSLFFPAVFSFVFYKLGHVNDLTFSDKTDCFYPYLVFISSNSFLVYSLFMEGFALWFIGITISFPLIILIAFLINLEWKISPYMLGIGGLLGTVLSVSYNVKEINPFGLFILLFLVAGFMGVFRLHSRKDTPAQVYIGFLLGTSIAFLTVFLSFYTIILFS